MSDDQLAEEALANFATYFSATTALIEACDWDEDKALKVFEAVVDSLENIYEYSLYDADLVKDYAELESLIKLNTKVDGDILTDSQLEAVVNLILIRAAFDKQEEEKKKQLN